MIPVLAPERDFGYAPFQTREQIDLLRVIWEELVIPP